MRPNINIRSIGWGIRYGSWLGSLREQKRILEIIQRYKYKPGFNYENLESMIRRPHKDSCNLSQGRFELACDCKKQGLNLALQGKMLMKSLQFWLIGEQK